MPGQQSLRGDDRCDLRQSASSEPLCPGCEPATLTVRESKSAATELLAQYPVLLTQVVDRLLLLLVHPAGNGNDHEPERIENATHAFNRIMRIMRGQAVSGNVLFFSTFELLDSTGRRPAKGSTNRPAPNFT
jgi:hypothetical protein